MPRRRHGAVFAVAGLAATLVAGPASSALVARAASAVPIPVFNHPVTVDAQRLVAEPDGTIGQDNRMYVSGPWGVTTSTSFIWRSEDGGDSFRQIQAAPGVQNPYPWRAGGDTEIQAFPPAGPLFPGEANPAKTPLYFADQNNLDSNTCGVSTDAGRSFTFTGGIVCPQTAGADRQWLTETRRDPSVAANGGLLDHDIHYLWYDHYQVGGRQLYRSEDGLNYTLGTTPPNTSGNPGNVVADRATGVVYMTAPHSTLGAAVSYSADGGQTSQTVQVPLGASPGGVSTDFTVLAIDTAGNLYLVWSGQNGTGPWQTWVTHTTGFTSVPVALRGGGTRAVNVAGTTATQWSTPVPITGPGSARPDINYSVFPWIAAGDPGRVDVVYYGTPQSTPYDPSSQDARWSPYMWQTLDFAAAVAAPTDATLQATAVASEGPSHLHSICFNGIGCTGQGNRNLLDFFEVKLDARGAAQVIYNDDANTLTALFPGGPFVTVGRQVGGASLYASIGSLGGAPSPDTTFQADPSGDGLYPTSDVNVPSLDLLGAGAQLKDTSTLEVTFKVSNLTGAVAQIPPTEAGTGIAYVFTWKHGDDVWFVGAHVDPIGTFTYAAGRPQSVPFTGTGGPKFVIYNTSQNATPVTTGTVDVSTGTITIDVPVSTVGGLSDGSRLLQATGFSLVERTAPAGINPGLADGADATPPFDDTLSLQAIVPEAPWTVSLLVLGAIAALAFTRWRRWATQSHSA